MAGVSTSVRLLGVPSKHQGTHDSLCAYYSAAMMLSALRPELDVGFESGSVRKDPIFAAYPRRGTQRLEAVVAEWLTTGVHLDRLARALDRTGGRRRATRFVHAWKPRNARTLAFVHAQVDAGLPCVLGWEGRELGLHTVCVTGYRRYPNGGEWLFVHDPARTQDEVEWKQLCRLSAARLEVIHCDAHDGVRPDKLTSVRRGKLRTTLDRWDVRAGAWTRVM